MVKKLDRKNTIVEIHEQLLEQKFTSKDLVSEAIENIKNDTHNLYEADNFKKALKEATNKVVIDPNKPLDGIPYVLKDNFSTKGIETTASSNTLNGYIPLYDATVFKKLKKAGAILVSKTTMDELAMGGTGLTGHKGATLNPLDKTRIIGGSSCGSAGSVVSNHVVFSIGSDTGDSVRKPASYGGIVGFKPSYGLISRYGLFAFAQSLDSVGYFTNTVLDAAILTDILAGYDKKDMTSYSGKYDKNFIETAKVGCVGTNLFYIPQLVEEIEDKEVVDSFYSLINKLRNKGISVEKVEFPTDLLKAIYPTYMILSSSEASSNNACLDGVRYGPSGDIHSTNYREYIKQARSKGFSEYIKRRFVIGSYALLSANQKEVFQTAMKARHKIVCLMKEFYKKFDGMLVPASQKIAPKVENITHSWEDNPTYLDDHMAIANFGGFPSITLPWIKKNGLPIGINLTCDNFKDSLTLGIAKVIEDCVKENK